MSDSYNKSGGSTTYIYFQMNILFMVCRFVKKILLIVLYSNTKLKVSLHDTYADNVPIDEHGNIA